MIFATNRGYCTGTHHTTTPQHTTHGDPRCHTRPQLAYLPSHVQRPLYSPAPRLSLLVYTPTVKGTDISSPHGVPIDLLDRLLIIKTHSYTKAEMKAILEIRAEVEGIGVEPAALDALAGIGEQTSLRYIVQLLTPSKILAQTNGRGKIAGEDVREANTLFLDAKTSARMLAEHSDRYLY